MPAPILASAPIWESPRYARWPALAPAPMRVFLSSTKLPICAPASTWFCMRRRAKGPAEAPRSRREVATMVKAPIWTSSASSESCTMEHAPTRQFSPITVLPRICAKGSMTVSMPIRTSASMVMVSGSSRVAPASITSRRLRSRKMASTWASCSRSLMPRASRTSSISMASTECPARARMAGISVR